MSTKSLKSLTIKNEQYLLQDSELREKVNVAVENISTKLSEKADKSELKTKLSEFTNDTNFIAEAAIDSKISTSAQEVKQFVTDQNYLTEHQDLSEYAKTSEVDNKIAALVDSAPEQLDTLNELATALTKNKDGITAINSAIATKASKDELTAVEEKVTANTSKATEIEGSLNTFKNKVASDNALKSEVQSLKDELLKELKEEADNNALRSQFLGITQGTLKQPAYNIPGQKVTVAEGPTGVFADFQPYSLAVCQSDESWIELTPKAGDEVIDVSNGCYYKWNPKELTGTNKWQQLFGVIPQFRASADLAEAASGQFVNQLFVSE